MTLQELVEATAQGRLDDLLSEPGNELTPELASQARELFKQAYGAGRMDLAQAAVMTASLAWLRLGDREQAVINFVDWQQIEYMRAETPAAYAQAREGLLNARGMALEIGARDQAFKAATIAADCSFWAAQATHGPEAEDLLLQTLRDVVAASELAEAHDGADFERYVSLLAAAANEAMSRYWLDEREAEAKDLICRLADASERTIPVDFTYSQAGDAEKTANTASILTALADACGG
jgi:hypothetical protein